MPGGAKGAPDAKKGRPGGKKANPTEKTAAPTAKTAAGGTKTAGPPQSPTEAVTPPDAGPNQEFDTHWLPADSQVVVAVNIGKLWASTETQQALGNPPLGPELKKMLEEKKKEAQEALDLLVETATHLFDERGEKDTIWGSMVKQALKRRKPGFNERYHGFRSFGKLLEQAQSLRLLDLEADEKSGDYVVKGVIQDD